MERTVCFALFIVLGVFVGDEMRVVGGKGWLLLEMGGCRREKVFLQERRSVSVGEKECFCRREGIKKMCDFSIFLLARARIET